MGKLLLYAAVYPVAAAAILLLLLLMVGWKLSPRLLWSVAGLGAVACGIRLAYLMTSGPGWGFDHRIFWLAGGDVWAGADPYAPGNFEAHPFLNPPSSLPLFALFAASPFAASLVACCLAYTALAVGGVYLARRCLAIEGGAADLPADELGALAAAFALSDACMAGLELGQLGLLAMGLVLAAVLASSRSRPILAGALLGLATCKVNTMLPFLILFLRRSDLRTWLSLGVTVVALLVVGGQPTRLLVQCGEVLGRIAELSGPGATNDVGYGGPQNTSILGFDHALYRVGLRDRRVLAPVALACTALLGLALGALIASGRVTRRLGLALVSLYAVVFLYHRLYDAVIVAPALVYAFAGARASSGRARLSYLAAAVAIFALLYMRREPLNALTQWAIGHGTAGQVVELLVLPYGTWCVLLAMFNLWLGDRWSGDGSAPTRAAS